MDWLVKSDVCPGLFYGTPAADGFLVRLRIAGGLLNQQQVRAIAQVITQGHNPTLQVTNRGNLQLRGIKTAPTPETFQILQAVGLAAQHPEIDRLRNFMASPTAGIDPQELLDTRPYIQALDTYIQNHPELATLPAKFSVGIDGSGQVGIGVRSPRPWEHRYNEIQLSAVALEDGIYFHLSLGGDKKLWDSNMVVKPADSVALVGALAAVYLDYSQDRSGSGVELPSRPQRMKHLLQDWGIDSYLQRVHQLLPETLVSREAPTLAPTLPYAHWGVHSQKQPELAYMGINLPLGQVTAKQWLRLGDLTATFGTGELRLTPWQSILLPNIPPNQVPELLEKLAELGLSASNSSPDAAIVACAGKPGCAASATHTQNHALELATYLRQKFPEPAKAFAPVNIHLTGCAKSCAQPSPAEITLLGKMIPQDGGMVEGYDVYVGDGERSPNLPAYQGTFAEILPQITHLLQNGGDKKVSIPPQRGEDICPKNIKLLQK